MISSGALPKVALSKPPTASPVRAAICSVDRTINTAIGHDGQGGGKEDHRGRHLAGVFEDHGGRNENEKPVDGGLHGTDSLDRCSYECIQFPTRQRRIAGYRIGHFGNSQLVGTGNERATSDGRPQGDINVGLRDWDSLIDSDLASSSWVVSTGSG